MCSGFSIKVGADMPADIKLFLDEELERFVPLTSPGEVKGSRLLGSKG